jgi:hypothetical protein
MKEADFIDSMKTLVDINDPESKLSLERAIKLGGRWVTNHK